MILLRTLRLWLIALAGLLAAYVVVDTALPSAQRQSLLNWGSTFGIVAAPLTVSVNGTQASINFLRSRPSDNSVLLIPKDQELASAPQNEWEEPPFCPSSVHVLAPVTGRRDEQGILRIESLGGVDSNCKPNAAAVWHVNAKLSPINAPIRLTLFGWAALFIVTVIAVAIDIRHRNRT